MQVRAQGRFRSGYQVGLSYAFSKSLGYATSASVQIPQYWRLNRGPQATDITHALCWKAC